MMQYIIVYLIIINVIGFALMGNDKKRAKQHCWRIPEKNLFLCALFGGVLGTWSGMYVFHHKTKHWYFVCGMPAIAAAWGCFAYVFLRGL